MADIKFLNNISLENLQLNNAKLQVVATDPVLSGATYEGRVIYNSTSNAIKFHNGADTGYWVTLDGSGDISSVAVRAGEGLEVESGADSATAGAFDVTLGLKSDVAGDGLTYSAGVISVNDDNATLTIGKDEDTASALTSLGAKHVNCAVDDIVIDQPNKLVTTPAYMLATSLVEADAGIEKLVRSVLSMN